MKIELQVKGMGHVPSFKNNKRSIRLKNGSTMIVTDQKTKKWMQRCIRSFVSQLSAPWRTTEDGTLTAPPPLSLIASSLPLDDSRQWISCLIVGDKQVRKGDEGATITVEEI